jgi:hypothetical protein
MRTTTLHIDVKLPSPTDFVKRFPHYTAVLSEERPLFDLIVTADNFLRARAVTDVLGLPAVTALADKVYYAYGKRRDWDFVKQLAGAIVCKLMEDNDYEKSGTKRAVSRPGWSKGEVYKP